MSGFHELKISQIKQETPSSVAVTFDVPQALKTSFSFTAGQYITLHHTINQQEVRRAYSICSAPSSGLLSVGIKKVSNGTFSVYANDQLMVGDALQVMPPQGTLNQQTHTKFLLVYGNQTKQQAMFYDTIEHLKAQFPDRFFVEYIYSRSQETNAARGRIDKNVVRYYLSNKYKQTSFKDFYVCGPEAMIDEVSNTLVASGVSKSQIHFELFTASTAPVSQTVKEGTTSISIIVDQVTEQFTMAQNKTILEAALEKQLDAPYSCQGGICSSCIGRVTQGEVQMRQNQILTDSEVAEGLVLTCQAHPVTPTVVVDYDDI